MSTMRHSAYPTPCSLPPSTILLNLLAAHYISTHLTWPTAPSHTNPLHYTTFPPSHDFRHLNNVYIMLIGSLDGLCPPLPPPPPVPPCCCFQDPRLLDPPCTYSPTLNITLPAGASSAFLRDHPEPGHARSGLSHDVLPPLRP